MPYDIKEHVYRLAVWGACTAARASRKKCTFKVKRGAKLIKKLQLKRYVAHPELLPQDQNELDEWHKELCERAIKKAKKLRIKGFSFGVAAKLINVYFKFIFVAGGHHENPRVGNLHPPIDSVLLKKLREKPIGAQDVSWRKSKSLPVWSKLKPREYQKIIDDFRFVVSGQPLWTIEQYWQGYQG